MLSEEKHLSSINCILNFKLKDWIQIFRFSSK